MKVLFSIFGYPIYFFGVMIAVGILAGLFAAYLEVKRKGLSPDKFFDLVTYSIIFAVLGARIAYIVFYDLSYYLNNPLDIIKISEGGLSIHGGLLGAFIFAFFYIRKHKLDFFKYADAIAPGIILGQGIGRVGCDVFGKVMTTPLPWGIERQGQLLHPAQVYEFLLDYLVFFILWRKRKNVKYDGQIFSWYIILFSINRGIVELLRTNPSVAGWFSVSHLLSVLFIIGAVVMMAFAKKKSKGAAEQSEPAGKWDWLKDILITLALIAVSMFIYYTVQG